MTFSPLIAVLCLATIETRQVMLSERLSDADVNLRRLQAIDEASWIWKKGVDVWSDAEFVNPRKRDLRECPSVFLRFRRRFKARPGKSMILHVSADERFLLLLDGQRIAEGPHRGLPSHWNYQSYELTLDQGEHLLEAVCWQLGAHAPLSQLSIRGGFILKAEGSYDAELTTGKAVWEVAELRNARMTDKGVSGTFGVGSECTVTGIAVEQERPTDGAYEPAVVVRGPVEARSGIPEVGWRLFPTTLPDQFRVSVTPGRVRQGVNILSPGVTIPPHSTNTVYWDLENYYCAYPRIEVSGGNGSIVRWGWTEAPRNDEGKKLNRTSLPSERWTKDYFVDTFVADGRTNALFTTPWWRCGRWCRLEVTTDCEPLLISKVSIDEVGYPLKTEGRFVCDDASVAEIIRICERGMRCCMHETTFDCPFYEQQMYPGDSRVQYLTSGVMSSDDRLIRKCISLFSDDRRTNGMIGMNSPTRIRQESSTYTLCWVLMLRDYLYDHDNRTWLKSFLPGMNQTLMQFAAYENADGLLVDLPGWSFIDWATGWEAGCAPDGGLSGRPSSVNNLLYLMAMKAAADVEAAYGEKDLTAYWQHRAERLARMIVATFWDEGRGLLADTVNKDRFSEHAQCLALLADVLADKPRERALAGLVSDSSLTRTTVYFSHYLLLTFFKFGRGDLVLQRLDLWRDYLRRGLCTPPEEPGDNPRSDCHAWGAHPIYHLHTGILGVKSTAPFYSRVRIAPLPGNLKRIAAVTPTPKGPIKCSISFENAQAKGWIVMPKGLPGTFVWNGCEQNLLPGVRNDILPPHAKPDRSDEVVEDSGLDTVELDRRLDAISKTEAGKPFVVIRAKWLAEILQNARVAVAPEDAFVDWMPYPGLSSRWRKRYVEFLKRQDQWGNPDWMGFWQTHAAFASIIDTSHTCPDWESILAFGPKGLAARASARLATAESDEQRTFLESVVTVYEAMACLCERWADAAEARGARDCATVLRNIAKRPPQTFREALQLMLVYDRCQEVEGEQVRSQGLFDRLYWKFYLSDLAAGRETRESAKELMRHVFLKFYRQWHPNGKNIALGGYDRSGKPVWNELTEIAFELHDELNHHNPKLSYRYGLKTPTEQLTKVARCIAAGRTAVVFLNEEIAREMFRRTGKESSDCADAVLIGCYEPGIQGREVIASMSTWINMPKALEYSMNGGRGFDGFGFGPTCPMPTSYRGFEDEFVRQLLALAGEALARTRYIEESWYEINPSPLMSGSFRDAVANAKDAYSGGLKYNQSGVMCPGLGTVVDSLLMIKRLVYDEKRVSLSELREILRNDWKGHEDLRLTASRVGPKWGNNDELANGMGKRICEALADRINSTPNGHGGTFQAGFWSIDNDMLCGERLPATANGRRRGEPLSRNNVATDGCGIEGPSALMLSVASIDQAKAPNGCILDLMVARSHSETQATLTDRIVSLMQVFLSSGGQCLHLNVFDARTLRDAQRHPERYADLQVRVCGWNARWNDLSKKEQDHFIATLEAQVR